MPGPVSDSAKKRKRASGLSQTRKRARSEEADNSDKDRIQHLESEILESKKNYNNISVLISTTRDEDSSDDLVLCASVSLCRVFMRLMASGALAIGPDLSEKEAVVAQWLRDRLMEYRRLLLLLLSRSTTAPTSLTLAMRLLKAEAERSDSGREEYSFSKVFFTDIVRTLVRPDADETVRQEFCDKFVNEYDDLRFFLFKSIT